MLLKDPFTTLWNTVLGQICDSAAGKKHEHREIKSLAMMAVAAVQVRDNSGRIESGDMRMAECAQLKRELCESYNKEAGVAWVEGVKEKGK